MSVWLYANVYFEQYIDLRKEGTCFGGFEGGGDAENYGLREGLHKG